MEPSGDWCLLLGAPGAAPVEARWSAARVHALVQAAQALPARAPAVLTPHAAARWQEAEQTFGRALATGLAELPELWAALWRGLGAIWAGDATAVLAISARSAAPRALPWELLATGPEGPVLATVHPFVVAQLGGVARPQPLPDGRRLRLVAWAPAPEDPVVQEALAVHTRLADRLGLSRVVLEGVAPAELPPAPADAADLLCVIAHGEAGAQQVSLLLPTGPLAPEAPASSLLASLERAALVILQVCAADAPTPDLADSLAGRLLLCGARSVLAPRVPWLARSFEALLQALIAELVRGQPQARAVWQSRAWITAQEIAHPGARAWGLRWSVSDLDSVERRLLAPGLPGPAPAEDARGLLEAAQRLATGAGHGAIGLEHLGLALGALKGGGPLTTQLRPLLWRQRDEIERSLGGLTPTGGSGAQTTPRLGRLLEALPGGYDLDALWTAVAAEPRSPLRGLSAALTPSDPRTRTARTRPAGPGPDSFSIDPPTHLEVVGGPEDGLQLRPQPGQILGRWTPQGPWPDLPLYAETATCDPRLSRRALRWIGPGRVEVHQQGARVRRAGGAEQRAAGELVLSDGDWLLLGDCTALCCVTG